MLLACKLMAGKKRIFNFFAFKQVNLFVLLLAQSVVVQAAATGLTAEAADDSTTAEPVVVSDNAEQSTSELSTQRYPRWPERKQVHRDMVPPPPPGPYMSSALSDFSVKGQTFRSTPDRETMRASTANLDPYNISMDAFSPDRPWPKSLRGNTNKPAPGRWKPDNGYQYVTPSSNAVSPGRISNKNAYRGSQNNYGYNSGPGFTMPGFSRPGNNGPGFNQSNMNWPGMSNSRMPSMSMGRDNNSMSYAPPQNRRPRQSVPRPPGSQQPASATPYPAPVNR